MDTRERYFMFLAHSADLLCIFRVCYSGLTMPKKCVIAILKQWFVLVCTFIF